MKFTLSFEKFNPRLGLINLIYQIEQDKKLCEYYAEQAEKNKEQALAEFYREIEAQDRLRCERAEELLRLTML